MIMCNGEGMKEGRIWNECAIRNSWSNLNFDYPHYFT